MKKEQIVFYLIVPLFLVFCFGAYALQLFISTADFADPARSGPPEMKTKTVGTVNINTATAEQLDALPGIGPAIAQRIIDHRKNYGPFRTLHDLAEVKGIGTQTILKMIEQIRLEDPS